MDSDGLLLNAKRCHRYIATLRSSAAVRRSLCGIGRFGAVKVDQHTFNNAVGAILVLALLSFVPEMVWKRYA